MELVENELNKCPEECKKLPCIPIVYGTSGFRCESKYLPPIMYRIGILASLRSKCIESAVGVIITASHNPEKDNGIKFIDSNGDMLCLEWEKYAIEICSTKFEDLMEYIKKLCQLYQINVVLNCTIFTARDTRKSGEDLSDYLISGIRVLPFVFFYNYGKITTPLFHYLVLKSNTDSKVAVDTEYYKQLLAGYEQFKQYCVMTQRSDLVVDCANGVGAIQLRELINALPDINYIKIINDESCGDVNLECGADYIYLNQRPPCDFKGTNNCRCVSFDGDGDRIIYYFKRDSDYVVLNGDNMIVLIVHYISELINKLSRIHFGVGLVYTAYTNSAITKYATKKNITCLCAKTGVKYLHSAAKIHDIGVYFEANGHGTVLFKPETIEKLKAVSKDIESEYITAQKLLALSLIFNQTGSDSLANLLAIELILIDLDLTLEKWNELVPFYPQRQIKISVSGKEWLKTTDKETEISHPDNMQKELDEIVSSYTESRAFIRPSGTENIIRIYAEAKTMNECEELCDRLKSLTLKYVPIE